MRPPTPPNPPLLPNALARRLFLHRHALAEAPAGPAKGAALSALIDRIGFVQIDSINTVARAHHMILFARRPSYRPEALAPLLEQRRDMWEHFTHDASILPVATFPHWRHRFRRYAERRADQWANWLGSDAHMGNLDEILDRIGRDGPVSVSEIGEGEARSNGGWWEWHPSKAALEWLWHTGRLAVTRRDSFRKVYDLTERVIPPDHLAHETTEAETNAWACNAALDRLGFATPGELAAYWALCPPEAARDWCKQALSRGEIEEVLVEGADGATRRSFARPGILTDAMAAPEPPARIRILSPFDPALRDRARAERLFGFHYRIEVFVPEPKRTYGYYVFPVLEGARLIGRIDMKRQAEVLAVRAFWPEAGVAMGTGREARLRAELDRMAGFIGSTRVDFAPDWQRETRLR